MVRGMALTPHMVAIDRVDPVALATFWTEPTGYSVGDDVVPMPPAGSVVPVRPAGSVVPVRRPARCLLSLYLAARYPPAVYLPGCRRDLSGRRGAPTTMQPGSGREPETSWGKPMESLTGRLLVATPALRDPNFERTVVLLVAHEDGGALGVVLNRATEVPVAEVLGNWGALAGEPAVVFEGGPVQP